ncbi:MULTISPECIES: MFS transporter [Flaviflexus]|uniref:MFS transporter n=1 Tax=Flaviflexus ciconiae TaxID=2496867 RepID=A0A3Q9G596_9ACTO|nr:MFS transporter [Flaviflexus ciconiae]AZQ77743.1 MFS transporter [Flaviflexus ciconiae]
MNTSADDQASRDEEVLARSERLERLPFTKKLGKLLGTSGVGWALDAMDVGLISFIVAALAEQWGLTDSEKSWVFSVGFIGMAAGATLGGLLADKIGRRSVFALTLLIYGIATGASALATSLGVLLVFRFLVGLGLGAELPVASTLVSEFAPKRIRGRVIVWLEAFWAIGWILAALIGYFIVAGSDDGWRWGLVIGAVPAIYALVIRLHAPESVRFLETKGKYDEAEKIVQEYEESAGPEYEYTGPTVQSEVDAEKYKLPQVDKHLTIWSPSMRRRTIALWIIWFAINFSYYGAFTWIPSLLTAQGFSLVKSFEFTLIITLAQIPGYALSAYLIEKIGRRSTLAIFLAGSAVAAILYGQAAVDWQIIAAGMMLSFFNLGAWGALYAIGPELYPTTVRGTGTGAAAGFGRIASIITPLLVPLFIGWGGNVLTFTVFSIAFAIAAGAAFFLPEQRGKSIH